MFWKISPIRGSNYRHPEDHTFLLSRIQQTEQWHNVSESVIGLHFRINQYTPEAPLQLQGMNITLLLKVTRDLSGALIECEGYQKKQHLIRLAGTIIYSVIVIII